MAAIEGGGGPVEITLRWNESEELRGRRYWSDAFVLQFGDRQIEVTDTNDERTVNRWIQDVHLERHRRSGGRDLVVGLCTFRRRPRALYRKERRDAARRDDYPFSTMSLCAGGTHCLVVSVEEDSYCRRSIPHPLAVFLADGRNTFVGIRIKKAAERLEKACSLSVAKAVELRPLVAGAFGKQAVPLFKGGRGDADGLRRMAKVALKGLDAGKKPATVEFDDRYLVDTDEKIMYASVDAFLT